MEIFKIKICQEHLSATFVFKSRPIFTAGAISIPFETIKNSDHTNIHDYTGCLRAPKIENKNPKRDLWDILENLRNFYFQFGNES